jgi:hypothetical protein
MRVARLSLLVCLSLCAIARSAAAADYYIAASGSDANAGSAAAPWQTLARASSAILRPGDRVLLRGGDSFSGTLSLDASDAGTAAAPIVIGSYGTGRATIRTTSGAGISVYNTSGVSIAGLAIVGGAGSTSGISVFTDLGGDVRLAFLRIDSVDVTGFGRDGIEIGAWNGRSGFRDVRVTNSSLHGNGRTGLFTYAQLPGSHQQVYVGHVRAYDNPGITGATSNTGSGIVLASVDGGTIERSVAHDNGRLSTTVGGPVGIWTYDSNAVVIQYNESYRNRTASTADGGGFDLDQNVSNSIVQYNYSHDNDGAGYLLAQSIAGDAHHGNIVRFNISQNDGRANSYGGIELWGRIVSAEIYNNTVYVSPAAAGAPRAVRIWNAGVTSLFVSGVHLRNNLFVTANGLPVVEVTAAALAGASDLRFESNNYFGSGSGLAFLWNGASYSGLTTWRATGQETLGGKPVGLAVDPLLTAPGAGQTLDDADRLADLSAYRLRDGSPMSDAGLDLALALGLDPGPTDFFGVLLGQRAGYDIGAGELPQTAGAATDEVLLLASRASTIAGRWRAVPDTTAANGARLYQPDAGAAKLTTPLVSPGDYFEMTFMADAGKPYRLWLRGIAEGNAWTNDSVFVQFSDSIDASGAPIFRIGTASATTVSLEDDNGAGVAGWGWQDNGWGTGVLGPAITFATPGLHTIRVQTREDGFSIDQIVLSARQYIASAPGLLKNDTTILAAAAPAATAPGEIVVHAGDLPPANLHGDWTRVADASAADGQALWNPNRGVAKIAAPAAAPVSYVDVPFTAQAGVPYQIWLRMRAESDSYANDSIYIQLTGAIDAAGQPVARIGTTQGSAVSLQDYQGAAIAGWGWNDNGWASLGTPYTFAVTGAQTLRIQQREDGMVIDQIVISPAKYLGTAPGSLTGDRTIIPAGAR